MLASKLDLRKKHFAADQIMLKIKLNRAPEKSNPIYQHLPDKTVMENGNIAIIIPDTGGASFNWFEKDEVQMHHSESVHLDINDEGTYQLMILNAKLSDNGLYEFGYRTRDGREVVTKFSLFVVEKLQKCKCCSSCVIL